MKLASLLLLAALAHGQQHRDFDNGNVGGGQGGQGEGQGNNVEGLGEWETDNEGMAAFSESAGGIAVLDEVPPPDFGNDEVPQPDLGNDEDDDQVDLSLPHCPYRLVSFSCTPGTGPSYVNT